MEETQIDQIETSIEVLALVLEGHPIPVVYPRVKAALLLVLLLE
jgi:hypothetical protein